MSNQTTEEDMDTKLPPSLIKLMLEGGMPNSEIRDNTGAFFLGGHETTASTLTWAMGLLATYPDVQQKIRQEVLEKIPNVLTYESVQELEYMDWFIQENTRLFPPVRGISSRRVPKDTVIGDYRIPANTVIHINHYSMLHDPTIWGSDAETFRPERWSPGVLTKEQRSSWMPFSYGPRVCLGMNFSFLEQKIFLSTLLRDYSVEFTKGASLEVSKVMSFIYLPKFDKLAVKLVKISPHPEKMMKVE